MCVCVIQIYLRLCGTISELWFLGPMSSECTSSLLLCNKVHKVGGLKQYLVVPSSVGSKSRSSGSHRADLSVSARQCFHPELSPYTVVLGFSPSQL